MKPISTSLVHKPKQLVTETQISLSCEVQGSVPDTDIKWMQNNRVFERGTVSLIPSFPQPHSHSHFTYYIFIIFNRPKAIKTI